MSEAAQEKLSKAHVGIVGAGGVGAACAAHLGIAGVGTLTLIDPAKIDHSDLNRHLLFNQNDVGKYKATILAERLKTINPQMSVNELRENFDVHTAERLLNDCDLVVDGLDEWSDKLILSDVCMQLNKPLVHAGLAMYDFHIFTMLPGRSSCLRCAFSRIGLEDAAFSQRRPGSLGAICGLVGAFQATEAIKLLAAIGTTPGNQLIKFDLLRRYFDEFTDLGPSPDCPDCGKHRRGQQ